MFPKSQLMQTVFPVIEQQVKKLIPLLQQLASRLPRTNPEDMFPVKWDVDEKDADEKYKFKLSVKDFPAENIKVKVMSDKVVVEGDHKEKLVNQGNGLNQSYISRYFITEFQLPTEVNSKNVQTSIKDGFVNIFASKKTLSHSGKKNTS